MTLISSGAESIVPASLREARHFINGEWVAAVNQGFIDVENPSTREIIAKAARGDKDDVARAVTAASNSFEAWRALPARERGSRLTAAANAIFEKSEEIARLMAAETGNALRTQARGETASAIDVFRYFGGAASEQKGETLPFGRGLLSYSTREPLGVVASIIPWNSPVVLAAVKIAMALSTGNTIVLKPAEDAPLAVLRMIELAAPFFPPGVLNAVTGTGLECGQPLVRSSDVSKISFTGSTAVGRDVMHAGADRILPVSLELGGKSPSIVFPDSLDEATVDGVIAAMRFLRQGQSCTAGSRLFVHASIFEDFIDQLVSKVQGIRIGDALDESTDMGAIINRTQFDRVRGYIQLAFEERANCLTGGVPPSSGRLAQGYFVEPTIFSGVRNSWRVSREEIFGPVLVAIPWTEFDDVISQANDTHYGLAAYVWAKDLSTAINAADKIDAGWIQVNRGGGQMAGMSYGGRKESGIGSEYSIEGALEGYTRRKSISIAV